LFRWGFAGYLVEATCDIALTLAFYVLLKPVRKDLALLAPFFGLVGTAEFAAEIFYLAPSLILGGAGYLKTFSPDQLNTLTLLSLKLFAYGGAMFTVFYGGLDSPWVLDLSIEHSSQVSRRCYDTRWSRVYHEELPTIVNPAQTTILKCD
jgi:hypothetical protein